MATKRFVDIQTGSALDSEQFSALFAQSVAADGQSAAGCFLRSHWGNRVRRLTYRPGKPLFLNEEGESALNVYRAAFIEPYLDDVSPWLDLVEHVFPDQPARDHFLDWLGPPGFSSQA